MNELKAELSQAAASMSLDEIVDAINSSAMAPKITDPLVFAAFIKMQAA